MCAPAFFFVICVDKIRADTPVRPYKSFFRIRRN